MGKRFFLAAAVAVSSIAFAGCASAYPPATQTHSRTAESGLADLVYGASTLLAERAEHSVPIIDKGKPIIVATMVSVDGLDRSSTFGRLSSQLILDKLAQRGFMVRDVTYLHALDVNRATGELVLTRDASRISRSIGAQAVVAGTYAVGGREIYLTIRMLNAEDGSVISSADVVLPLDANSAPLVGPEPVIHTSVEPATYAPSYAGERGEH